MKGMRGCLYTRSLDKQCGIRRDQKMPAKTAANMSPSSSDLWCMCVCVCVYVCVCVSK